MKEHFRILIPDIIESVFFMGNLDAEYRKLRNDIRTSRADYPFCKYCDFIDAGLRMDTVDDTLHHREANHGARQSLFRK